MNRTPCAPSRSAPARSRAHRRDARRVARRHCGRKRRRRPAPRFDAGVISGLGARNIGSATMSGRIAAVAARAGKDGKTTLFVGAASRRRVEVAPTAARRSSRCSTSSRCSRSARSRSIRRTAKHDLGRHRRGVDAQLGLDRRRHLQVDRRRRDLDQHGPARTPSASRKIIVDPTRRQHRLRLRARQAVERFGRSRPLQDDRRRQDLDAGAQGREPVDRLLGARDGSEESRTCCSPACGTSAARAGRSAPAANGRRAVAAAACSASADGGTHLDRSHRRREQGLSRRSPGAASRSRSRRRDPKIVYAFVESTDSALFRSDDGGTTWERARQEPDDGLAAVLLRAASSSIRRIRTACSSPTSA